MPNTNDAVQNGLVREIQDNYSLVFLANKYKAVRCHSFGEGRTWMMIKRESVAKSINGHYSTLFLVSNADH